jgi:hypothetical protein
MRQNTANQVSPASSEALRPAASGLPASTPRSELEEKFKATNVSFELQEANAEQDQGRKIIRRAELSIETMAVEDAQRRISVIAEAHGGFVVTSEYRQLERSAGAAPGTVVTVALRIPAERFAAVMAQLRGINGSLRQEKITGQDVTEEYIDLEARLRSKRALEMQFLEIMKGARKVSDALDVQTQLSEVRTEIERIEGRRRLIENQASLSTIIVALSTPAPVVLATTRGFFGELRSSLGESFDLASDLILGIIRFLLVMIPISLLVLLPVALVARFAWHRRGWLRRPATP